jgi:hypothetical protein
VQVRKRSELSLVTLVGTRAVRAELGIRRRYAVQLSQFVRPKTNNRKTFLLKSKNFMDEVSGSRIARFFDLVIMDT